MGHGEVSSQSISFVPFGVGLFLLFLFVVPKMAHTGMYAPIFPKWRPPRTHIDSSSSSQALPLSGSAFLCRCRDTLPRHIHTSIPQQALYEVVSFFLLLSFHLRQPPSLHFTHTTTTNNTGQCSKTRHRHTSNKRLSVLPPISWGWMILLLIPRKYFLLYCPASVLL